MITLGSISICILASIMLVLYICAILRQKSIFVGGIKLILGGIFLILLRLLLPVNFPFRIDIPVRWLMPDLQLFFQRKLADDIMIAHIILGICGIGSLISLFIKIYKYVKMRRLLEQAVYITEIAKKEHIQQFLSHKEAKRIQIAVLYGQDDMVPCITGLCKPILVLPDRDFSNKELSYIIRHEMEHYRSRDLWLKALMEFLISIYWWNPLMYIFREKFYLALEVSDDIKTTSNMDVQEKIFYAECLYHVAVNNHKKGITEGLSLFHAKKDLHLRIHNILSLNYNRKKQICSTIFNLYIVLVIGIACLIFVPEAYEIPESDAQGSVKLTEDNSYLIETENGYDLYIDDNYMTTLTELPKTIELKIYKEDKR